MIEENTIPTNGNQQKSQGQRRVVSFDSLELFNFKSFANTHHIGPFLQKTAILGQNGGGKSNILDAVVFVLASKLDKTKYSSVKQFVNNSSGNKGSYVKIHCTIENNIDDHITSERVEFKRTIDNQSKTRYFFNDTEHTKDNYRDIIRSVKLDSYIGVCVLSQNSAVSMIEKNGNELREMFECLAGNSHLIKDYESKKDELKSIKINMSERTEAAKTINKELKLAKDEKENQLEFANIESQYETLEFESCLAEVLSLDVLLYRNKDELTKLFDIQKKLRSEYDNISNNIQEKNDELFNKGDTSSNPNSNYQNSEINAQIRSQIEAIGKIQVEKFRLQADWESISKKLNGISQNLFQVDKKIEEAQNSKQKLEDRKSKILEMTRVDQNNQVTTNLPEFESNINSQLRDWEKVEGQGIMDSQAASQQNSSSIDESTLATRKRTEINMKKNEENLSIQYVDKLKLLKSYKIKKQDLTGAIAQSQTDIENEARKLDLNKHELANNLKKQQEIDQSLDQIFRLKKENEIFGAEIKNLSENELELKSENSISSNLQAQVKGYRGLQKNLVRPIHEKYTNVVKNLMGAVGNYLVVDDEAACFKANAILKENYKNRTILVLDKVPRVDKEYFKRYRLKKDLGSNLAYDVVEPEKGYENIDDFLRYHLKSKFVTDNFDKSLKLKAKLNEKGISIFTLDGAIIKPGEVSSLGDQFKESSSANSSSNNQRKIEDLKFRILANETKIETLEDTSILKVIDDIKAEIEKSELGIFRKRNEIKSLNEEILKTGNSIMFTSGEKDTTNKKLTSYRKDFSQYKVQTLKMQKILDSKKLKFIHDFAKEKGIVVQIDINETISKFKDFMDKKIEEIQSPDSVKTNSGNQMEEEPGHFNDEIESEIYKETSKNFMNFSYDMDCGELFAKDHLEDDFFVKSYLKLTQRILKHHRINEHIKQIDEKILELNIDSLTETRNLMQQKFNEVDREKSKIKQDIDIREQNLLSLRQALDKHNKDLIKYSEQENALRQEISKLRSQKDSKMLEIKDTEKGINADKTRLRQALMRRGEIIDEKKLTGIDILYKPSQKAAKKLVPKDEWLDKLAKEVIFEKLNGIQKISYKKINDKAKKYKQWLKNKVKKEEEKRLSTINEEKEDDEMDMDTEKKNQKSNKMAEEVYEDSDDETNYDNTELFKLYSEKDAKKFYDKILNDFMEVKAKYNTMSSNLSNDRNGSKFEKREKKFEEELKKIKKEIQNLVSKSRELDSEFSKIKKIRNERLRDYFSKVKPLVERLYKILSVDNSASATLYQENSSDPCQGAIIYTPTPATKKFVMSSDSLSSGEKSIAALALFFAVNEALKTPIIFVDEIDAHLDKHNAYKLMQILSYLSNTSKKQVVYISHRPVSYNYADVLQGIYFESTENTSKCFSLHNDSAFSNTVQPSNISNSENPLYRPISEDPMEQDAYE